MFEEDVQLGKSDVVGEELEGADMARHIRRAREKLQAPMVYYGAGIADPESAEKMVATRRQPRSTHERTCV